MIRCRQRARNDSTFPHRAVLPQPKVRYAVRAMTTMACAPIMICVPAATVELVSNSACVVILMFPLSTECLVRQTELNGFVMGIEQQQEAVIGDPLAAVVESKESAVDEDAQRPSVANFPVLTRHLLARGLEPCAIFDANAMNWAPLEPIATVKHWVGLSQLNDRASEGKEALVHARPVQPRDLVVLAICIVVASLSPSEFVPGNQHRDALREQQRRQEIPHLANSQQ